MSLTIALATRGRPGLLTRTVQETLPNLSEESTRLVVLVDEDDKATAELRFADPRVIVSVEPREDSLGEKFNRALRVAPADVYMHMTDYAPYLTPGTDRKVEEASRVFPDGIGVVFNHMANLSFPYLNAVTKRWVELVGYFYPGYFPYWFVDHWLDDLARITDRFTCADVHANVVRRPGTQDQREPKLWGIFFDALIYERRAIAMKIIDAMDEPQWRKDVLRARAHLVEERSMMVNQIVRGLIGTDQTTDARYERIKAKALAKLREVAPLFEAA